MDFEIREATEADLADITRIYNFAIEHTTDTFDTDSKTIGDRLKWFQARTHAYPIIVATIGGQVVGWADIRRYGDRKAYRLHETFGFQEVGIMREVGYKFDEWLDVIVMQKLLTRYEPDAV